MFFRTVSRLLLLVLLASAPFQTIGTAALPNNGMPQSSTSTPVAKAGCTIQLLTNPEGVDFNQCLREVYLSVRKRWFANMPPSVEKGDQGVDSVEFRILQDGSVPKESLKVVVSSRKTALDRPAYKVFARQPFSHLPEKFSQPFVELRFVFYYNLPIPQNK
jgi:hypothetical protein